MDERELISLLNVLIKAPSLIKNISGSVVDTELGKIERENYNVINITLHNGVVTSIYAAEHSNTINDLFDGILKSAEEFGIYLLKDRLKKCYDVLSNNSADNQRQ